jgi:AraC-like DNA-binding protein
MEYREFRPSARLARAVQCVWTLSAEPDAVQPMQPVLPDGRPELILHFGDRFDRDHGGNRLERQAAVLYAGQLTEQLVLRPSGRIAVVGVRFHAFGAATLLRMPQHELAGLTVGVETVSPLASERLDRVMHESASLDEAAVRVQAALEHLVDDSRVDPRLRHAERVIRRSHGTLAIDAVADTACLCRRQLERHFLDVVGVTPKRLARIARFQHALGLLEQESVAPGTTAAAASGYADQAHFARDFRKLAGCSPSEHLLRQAEMTGLFIERGSSNSARR